MSTSTRTLWLSLRPLLALAAILFGTIGSVAHAQTLYWDTGTSSGLTPGNGTWSTGTSDLFWATSTSPATATPTFWTNGSIANFQGTGASGITISGTVTASAVQFAGGLVNTSISGGTLIVSSASGMSSAGTNGGANASISSNVVLGTGSAQTYQFSTTSSQIGISIFGNISENGVAGITKVGSQALTLAGTNTYTGVTTISAGVVNFAKRVSLYNADTSKWTASNLNIVSTAAFNVGGTGEFTDSDIGTLAALGTATGGFRSGSQLRLDTGNAAGGSFTLSSTIANPNSGANVLNLAKVGNGTLELTGANIYTGQTIVQTGVLKFSTIGDWAASGAAATNLGAPTSAANGQINLANGVANQIITLLYVGAGSTTNRSLYYQYGVGGSPASVTIDSAGTGPLVFTSGITGNNTSKPLILQGSYTGAANEIQGAIAGTGVSALTKSGAGTWKLSGANTYGSTTINAGVLEVTTLANGGVASGIGNSSNLAGNLVFGAPSATLRYSGTANVTTDRGFVLSSGAGGGATIESSGAGTLSFDNTVAITSTTSNQTRVLTLGGTNTGNNTFSKVIANNGTGVTSLTKAGSGVWVLDGANTFTGTVTIGEGTLAVASIGNAGSTGPLGTSGTIALGTSTTAGTLRYTGAGETTNRVFNLAGGAGSGGRIEANGSGPLVVSGSVSAATGDKTLTLAGSNTDNNSIGAIPQPATSGTTSLVKTGAGTWLLTGSSGYRGSTSVDQGTLLLGANAQSSGQNGGLGFSSSAPITIGNAAGSGTAALLLQGGVQVDTRILTVPTGSQLTVLGGANTTGTSTFGSAGSAEIQFQRNIRLQAGTGGTVVFANIWSATGGGSVPANNVTIGTSDNAGTVRLDSVLGTTGAVNASYGTLRLGVTGALPSASAINIGVAGTSSAEVDYAATGETISRNVFALGNGRNRIRNSGTGTLTLSGTLTKDGTILELAGGTFNVTGPITGTSAGSDLYVNGATVTLTNSNNSYNGPTYVYGNGTLNLAASNVIPSGSILTLGATGTDTGSGTLVVGSLFDSFGGLNFGTGGGTVMMTASGTAGLAQLTAPSGTVALAGGTLNLTGSGTTSGLYRLFSAQSVTGSFASITGTSPAYQVVTTSTSVDYQQRAVLGTLSVTNPSAAIITGGSAAFTYTVANSALSGGAGLSFSGTGASNVGGSSAGSAAAGSTSGAVSGMVFTGTSVGAGQQGTFTVTAPTAYGATTSTGTVSVTVLDHATSSLGASLLLSDTISLGTWNYATQTWESGTDSGLFTLFNIASSYGAGLTADLSLVSVSGAANGFSTDLNTYTDIAGGSSRGYYVLGNTASWLTSGTQTATFTIQMSDKTGMAGATASNTLTLTASVIVVPEPATLALAAVGIGLGGWATLRRRRK